MVGHISTSFQFLMRKRRLKNKKSNHCRWPPVGGKLLLKKIPGCHVLLTVRWFFSKKKPGPQHQWRSGCLFCKKKPGRHWQPEYIFEFFKNLVRF
jgi:hypothetical protein